MADERALSGNNAFGVAHLRWFLKRYVNSHNKLMERNVHKMNVYNCEKSWQESMFAHTLMCVREYKVRLDDSGTNSSRRRGWPLWFLELSGDLDSRVILRSASEARFDTYATEKEGPNQSERQLMPRPGGELGAFLYHTVRPPVVFEPTRAPRNRSRSHTSASITTVSSLVSPWHVENRTLLSSRGVPHRTP